jgi:uncharacterized membrane protein
MSLKNILVILALLFGGFLGALAVGAHVPMAGRMGLAVVFLFTSLGHFARTTSMAEMLPPFVPARAAMIVVSGVFEAGLAVTLVVRPTARLAGVAAVLFLVAITPVNVVAAFRRAQFGGHAAGPRYLWVRLPLQALLVIWTYWFAIHMDMR